MSLHPQNSKLKFIIATLLLLMSMACGSLNRLQELNQQNQIQSTTTPNHQLGQPDEVSDSGNTPVTTPTFTVNAVTATTAATTPSQVIIPAKLYYQDKLISFDITPVQASNITNTSPRQAEIQLMLHRLPGSLFSETGSDPFLMQLKKQLTLSIPERNLVITSTGFQLNDRDPINRTLKISYFFNTDIETLNHVELILSGPGNPLFMPVAVE